jgi:CheY-like chemotaxis protein
MSDRPVTVYIAEDNPILLQGLERALSANGYQVQTAADGSELMGLLGSPPFPDVLLLDVMMPGRTGLEVLDAVRADRRTADLPVVLITAATEEVVPSSALEHPRVDLLMKPFRLNDLLSRLEQQVREARHSRADLGPAAAPPPVPR